MRVETFLDMLARVQLDYVFNPYTDICDVWDLKNAPSIRCQNLRAYMRATEGTINSVWFGRDLGYRGGRRTGLPLTDENHLEAFSDRYGGVSVSRATNGAPMSERTARTVWQMMEQLPLPPFLWNIFPFHPHERDQPMTNRCHTANERRHCEPLIEALMEWLQPTTIIAIGKDAFRALDRLGYACDYVRHPSYGGQTDFIEGISELHSIESKKSRQYNLLELTHM